MDIKMMEPYIVINLYKLKMIITTLKQTVVQLLLPGKRQIKIIIILVKMGQP